MYQVQNPSASEFIPVRLHRYHLRVWGDPADARPPLVLLHGWMDVGASYQFMVDALLTRRRVIAPDWRGYGLTEGPATDNYWLPDYLADLDVVLDHCANGQPVDLVGHSMGGNLAMLYAGVRPKRIRRLVNLEGFGMAATQPEQVGARYVRWIDELKKLHRGELGLKSYNDAAGVARRLMKNNPRLSADKANWLAQHWAKPDADGRWLIQGDPAHKVINANLYQVPETLALYRQVTAPTLVVVASDDSLGTWWRGKYTLDEFHVRLREVPDCRTETVQDAGHMLHHDQPERLARLIEDFLASGLA